MESLDEERYSHGDGTFLLGYKESRPVFDRKADVPTAEENLCARLQLTCQYGRNKEGDASAAGCTIRVFKSHFKYAYIVLIWGRSSVLRAIQLHSHRQPEHPGDSSVEVVPVKNGPLQVVCIRSRDASLWIPGSLLEGII